MRCGWSTQVRKVRPPQSSGAKEIELEFGAREFERTCCRALQGASRQVADGEDPPNPVSLGDISHYGLGVRGEAQSAKSPVRVPASLVYRHLDTELAKAHNAFLRGGIPVLDRDGRPPRPRVWVPARDGVERPEVRMIAATELPRASLARCTGNPTRRKAPSTVGVRLPRVHAMLDAPLAGARSLGMSATGRLC